MPGARSWKRMALEIAVVAVVSIAAYAASLQGYLLSDDFHVVTLLNAQRTGVNWPNALSDFIAVYRGDPTHSYYRPMITLSAAVDYSLWGPNPFGGHLTNLFLNTANCLLVYGIATALPTSPAGGFALLAGLLFALHPLHPEAVYWLVGRTELIVACFGLLSLFFFLVFLDRRRPVWWLVSIFAVLLALGSKETAVVLPFALTLLLLCFPSGDAGGRSLRVATLLTPYYLLLGGYFVLRKAITGHVFGQYGAMGIEPFAPASIPRGIEHLIVYQLRPTGGPLLAPAADALVGQAARRLIDPLMWMLVLAIVGLVVAARPDRRAWFSLSLMLVFAFPLLSIIAVMNLPIEFARLYYLPSVGFCLFLASLIAGGRPPLARALGVIVLACFAGLLAVNSLPWVHAARINRQILSRIERAANSPGVRRVVVTGNPDVYFGAELFGKKSWAVEVAAARPFVTIPAGVRIVNLPETPCAPPPPDLPGDDGIAVLRWDPHRRTISEVGVEQILEMCRHGSDAGGARRLREGMATRSGTGPAKVGEPAAKDLSFFGPIV